MHAFVRSHCADCQAKMLSFSPSILAQRLLGKQALVCAMHCDTMAASSETEKQCAMLMDTEKQCEMLRET